LVGTIAPSVQTMIRQADAALYAARVAGRKHVFVAAPAGGGAANVEV